MSARRRFSVPAARPRRQSEPTIALINIVFLMLIFFLIAGTVASPLPPGLTAATTEDSPPAAPPDALAVDAEGALYQRGVPTDLDRFVAETDLTSPVRIAVDQALPASELVGLVAELRRRGTERVVLVTEQADARGVGQ